MSILRIFLRGIHSFQKIPGPRSYPVVGTRHNYVFGKYKLDELHRAGLKKYREFGPVVREEIVPGVNVVFIFRPEDVQELFRREGRHPQRRSHLALEHYRRSNPDIYNSGGLLPTNGEQWAKLRRVFQKGLSSPQAVRQYLPVVNEAVDEFAALAKGVHGDFLPYLSRIFLEMLGLVAFDCRLDCFSKSELHPESRTSRLMDSAMTINSCILATDNGSQIWRRFPTPIYRKLSYAHRYLESVAVDLIRKKRNSTSEEKSILETYMSAKDIDTKDIVGMCADMLLAGIDTTTYSTAFALYHLARNPSKQEKLQEEADRLLGDGSSVTGTVLNESRYLKAVVKESFRLNPISVGIGRILTEDAVFSGYPVPKGVTVVTQNQVTCRFEEFFREPESFIPERWIKDGESDAIHPYLVLPFGHGPRTCIARRLAEQNIQTVILKLVHRYNIRWFGGELDCKSLLINKPDGRLELGFVPRR